MLKIGVSALFLLLQVLIYAQNVNVAIFYTDKPTKLVFIIENGTYTLQSHDSLLANIPVGKEIHISTLSDNVLLQFDDSVYKVKTELQLKGSVGASFSVNAVPGKGSARFYEGNLSVKNNGGVFLLINNVPLENYVAAVVEAEGGYNKPAEFYKTQAVITRTYALKNISRHSAEGFELCDGTHCQAYKHKVTRNEIVQAVNATAGLVLVNASYELIMAAYHSNSGGVTMNSEDVWISALSYLRTVNDKYYVYGRNAVWQQTITVEQWKSFLKTKGVDVMAPVDSTLIVSNQRLAKVDICGKLIPLTEVRHYFKLPSAFLSMSLQDDKIIISGRGYGHGVGLSQESAMRMAEEGINYKSILQYFYKDIYIVNMRTLSVFKTLEQSSGK